MRFALISWVTFFHSQLGIGFRGDFNYSTGKENKRVFQKNILPALLRQGCSLSLSVLQGSSKEASSFFFSWRSAIWTLLGSFLFLELQTQISLWQDVHCSQKVTTMTFQLHKWRTISYIFFQRMCPWILAYWPTWGSRIGWACFANLPCMESVMIYFLSPPHQVHTLKFLPTKRWY